MYDAIVVGARVAGSATGLLLARQGHSVLIVDRVEFPSDTWSTHFVTAAGTALLKRWGALEPLQELGVPVFDTIVVNLPDGTTVNVKDIFGPADVCSPRRTDLDTTLSQLARDAGAEVRFGVTVTGLLRDEDGRVTGVTLRDNAGATSQESAHVVIGADGRTSTVAKEVGAADRHRHEMQGAAVFAYFDNLECPAEETCMKDGTFMFIFPTKKNSACVGAAFNVKFEEETKADPEAMFGKYMAMHPEWQQRLASATRDGRWRLGELRDGYFRHASGAGWALVGDAACLKDPLPGHGITDSFLGAELLARAVHQGLSGDLTAALAQYDDALWDLLQPIYEMTVAAATYDKPGADIFNDIAGIAMHIGTEREEVEAGGPFLDRPA